ncbi:MAG: helicase C-terminal domain-containing protein [Candidatus Bathyarchaeia archaeon]
MARLLEQITEYFPYRSVRPHQDSFMNIVYEALEERKHAIVEGSNGLGKTVALLSACLPIAKKQGLTILYTAKTHRQHDRVIEELNAISKRREVSGFSIRGRSEMCLHPLIRRSVTDARSAMEVCELLKSREQCRYHRKMEENPERRSELQLYVSSKPLTATEIRRVCHKEGFCPYELTKFLLSEVNVVALSYLYVFDPQIRAAFLKHLEKPLNKTLLIVDEAHNLPDTAVEIASDNLSLFTIRQAELEAKNFHYKDIAEFSRRLKTIIERASAEIKKEEQIQPKRFIELLQKKAGVDDLSFFSEYLEEAGNTVRQNLLKHGKYPRSYIHRIGEFLIKWLETADNPSFTHVLSKYIAKTGTVSARLEVVALDPSNVTAQVFSNVYCCIAVSGTLQPLDSFRKITGLPENTVQRAVASPFPREHVLALISKGVTTALEKRTTTMYKKLVKRICEAVYATPANVGVFTPSYEVLEALLNHGLKVMVKKTLLHEYRNMSSKENEKLINHFKSYATKGGAVLLGVQGGRSSEGTDYPGDQMNTVVVVGVPYAEPTPKVKAQINYYEEVFPGSGREFGYVLPALKKASQAAGRPIRTLEDKGAIIFLDYRFATSYCQRFLPLWIRERIKILPDMDGLIARELKSFFG